MRLLLREKGKGDGGGVQLENDLRPIFERTTPGKQTSFRLQKNCEKNCAYPFVNLQKLQYAQIFSLSNSEIDPIQSAATRNTINGQPDRLPKFRPRLVALAIIRFPALYRSSFQNSCNEPQIRGRSLQRLAIYDVNDND